MQTPGQRARRRHSTNDEASSAANSPHRNGWLGIELRHLAALEAVARGGSFRGAAEELGYVQSAISQQIAFLERLLGVRLLERSKGSRTVTPTAAGELMLAHADDIVTQMRAAKAQLAALPDGAINELRVGAFDDVASRLIPRVIRAFARTCPAVEVLTTETTDDQRLLELVETGEIDIAFAELPVPQGRFASTAVLEDGLALVVAADSHIARRDGISRVEGLSGLAFIRQPARRHSTRVEAELLSAGIEFRYVRSADSTATIQALVGAGVGCALLPRLAIAPGDTNVVALDVAHILAPRTLGLVWREGSAAAAALDRFIGATTTVCRELTDRREAGCPGHVRAIGSSGCLEPDDQRLRLLTYP